MSRVVPSLVLGLELLFLPLLDLDSDLEEPLTIFVIFCTVFSVIDSDLDTFSLLLGFSFVDLSSFFNVDFSARPLGEHSLAWPLASPLNSSLALASPSLRC